MQPRHALASRQAKLGRNLRQQPLSPFPWSENSKIVGVTREKPPQRRAILIITMRKQNCCVPGGQRNLIECAEHEYFIGSREPLPRGQVRAAIHYRSLPSQLAGELNQRDCIVSGADHQESDPRRQVFSNDGGLALLPKRFPLLQCLMCQR